MFFRGKAAFNNICPLAQMEELDGLVILFFPMSRYLPYLGACRAFEYRMRGIVPVRSCGTLEG